MMLYRRVVAPLRLKLIESDSIIERHQKLAHFGELAAGVSHEIRNPLTAINARLFTLQKSLTAGTPAFVDANVIRNEITRLDRIVKDFLELARPAQPILSPTTAEALLKEVVDLLQPPCEKKSITLQFDTMVDTPFLADSSQIKQVFINLIQNAAESIGQNGTIILRARNDSHRLREKQTEVVVIEVQDNGAGIPPAIQKQLFDPFFSTKKGGTGLGLSISAQIVEKHGGTLTFRTNPGRSTVFNIILPVYKETS